MLDTTAIDDWLSGYLKAWSSDAPEDVAALFEPDARYFSAPFRAPYVGREAIVEWWVGRGDSAIPWTFEYEVVAIEGALHVVRGVTTYLDGIETPCVPEVFDTIWLVTLSGEGKASEFVEYWMLRR